jgi:hypothetical protein
MRFVFIKHCALVASWVWVLGCFAFAPPCSAQDAAAQVSSGFDVRIGAGLGVGHREITAPTRSGDRLLNASVFPALSVGLDASAAIGASWLFGLRLHYQTSIAAHAHEEPAAGSGKEASLRLHHVELGITPGLRFSDGPSAVQLRLFAGWGFRGLRAVTEIALPQYLLHGPVFRPELRVPFPGGSAELRLAPELQFVSGISDALRVLSNTAWAGIAWGGEVALSVRLGPAARFYLDYRESRARVGSAWGAPLTDIERFASVGLDLCF